MLGVCEDGLPLLIDFLDASAGSVLILSDAPQANHEHLTMILASVCALNTPRQVRTVVLTPNPKAFLSLDSPGIDQVLPSGHEKTFQLLGEQFGLVEKQLKKKKPGPIQLLIIDQLQALVAQLDPSSLSFLRFLVRQGPKAGVWIIASLCSQDVPLVGMATLRTFGTRVLGQVEEARLVTSLLGPPAASPPPGPPLRRQARIILDEEIVLFDIPGVEGG